VSRADELEAAARARFARWDPRLWRHVVDGPARALDGPAAAAYLELCAEAIGLGYLVPAAAGRDAFFNLAFLELVPAHLGRLPPPRQAEILAALWNIGENLAAAAPWLERILVRVGRGLTSLDRLEEVVAGVERQALGEPTERLGPAAETTWIDLGAEDRRFLPGALHFIAPTVLCVHDRLRADASLGVWLGTPPLVLGSMGCAAPPAVAADTAFVDEPYATCANPWRAAAALVTSQRIVARAPSLAAFG
jgi:hypothetical protein